MGVSQRAVMRGTALHLDRYRAVIEAEVDRRMGRSEPPSAARAEIVRRFRTFCRLASIDLETARPSLDGLAGNDPAGLERAVAIAVDVAIQCCPTAEVGHALRDLDQRFRTGLRRIMVPREEGERTRRTRRKKPNAGRRVRAAIDRIGDAYLALCLDTGRVYDVNPAAETLLGIESEVLLQKPLADLVPDSDRDSYRSLESRLDAGEDTGLTRLAFSRGDGDTVRAEVSITSHTISGRRLAIFILRETLPDIGSSPVYSTRTRAPAGIFATSQSTARSR